MDVLKPPTDNLYKFIAIFGLIIFVVSVAAPYVASEELSTLVADMKKPIAEMQELNEENNRLFARQDEIIKSLPELSANTTDAEKQLALSRLGDSDRILEAVRGNLRSIRERETASDIAMKKVDARADTLLGVVWWSYFGRVIGLICIFLGFTLWYFKLQRYQDLLLRNQVMESTKETPPAKPDEDSAAPSEEEKNVSDNQ